MPSAPILRAAQTHVWLESVELRFLLVSEQRTDLLMRTNLRHAHSHAHISDLAEFGLHPSHIRVAGYQQLVKLDCLQLSLTALFDAGFALSELDCAHLAVLLVREI
jgi:hypothetical protein